MSLVLANTSYLLQTYIDRISLDINEPISDVKTKKK
jgi:hypothetical protein